MTCIDQDPSSIARFGFHVQLTKYVNGYRLSIFEYEKQFGRVSEYNSFIVGLGKGNDILDHKMFEMTEEEVMEHIILENI